MIRLLLVVLLSFGAMPAIAQPSGAAPIQPNVDSPAQRQALRSLLSCLIEQRPLWARRTMAQPYLSESQARMASQALSGRDTCLPGNSDTEITFRTSSLVGALAELMLRAEIGQVDQARLAATLARLSPLNVSEDFALCVTSRDAPAARELALSGFGSEAESTAAQRLSAGVGPCTNPGENLTVDVQALRALVSIALYRAVTSIRPATN
jgi:hypothetical protein